MDNESHDWITSTLLTEQEIMDAISFVNEGAKEDNLSQIVRYSKRMYFVAVNTDVSSREIAEQYEGFASYISQGDSDGLIHFIRTDMPLMEMRVSDDPLLQGRSAVAFMGHGCAQAARNGGLPVGRCFEIVQNYQRLANDTSNEELVHYLMLPMMLELTKAVCLEGRAYTHPISHHAMTYVRSHLNEPLDGDSVAEACGVSRKTLDKYGAVSEQAAREMAKGVTSLFKADVAVAVSGNAGPDASEGKPVGLVYIAVNVAGKVSVKEFNFSGDRAKIRNLSVANALVMMRQCILEYYGRMTFGSSDK